ncbi:unnamed protein product, partial [Mesorhabditis spiculigera]
MTSLNEALSRFTNEGSEGTDEGSPKRDENGSPVTDDTQIGDIGAMAIQQLAASQAANSSVPEEVEREMSQLERDIKRQKESSANAKTAITFDQLKKIHQIGKVLGPQKEAFYDRICRAADIQRASLKNRLKQNKEKFEPGAMQNNSSRYNNIQNQNPPPPLTVDSPIPPEVNFGLNGSFPGAAAFPFMFGAPPELSLECKNYMRMPLGMDHRSMSPGSPHDEDTVRIPVERVNELFQLGFTYDDVKEFNGLFEQFKSLSKELCPPAQLLSAFSNFISQSVPEPLKLICTTFNLLEMGYTRREMQKIVNKERRHRLEEENLDHKGPAIKRQCYEEASEA